MYSLLTKTKIKSMKVFTVQEQIITNPCDILLHSSSGLFNKISDPQHFIHVMSVIMIIPSRHIFRAHRLQKSNTKSELQ